MQLQNRFGIHSEMPTLTQNLVYGRVIHIGDWDSDLGDMGYLQAGRCEE